MSRENAVAATEGAACLPVTALYVVLHGTHPLLLAANGSALTVYHASYPYSKLYTARIFNGQNIHGISSVALRQQDPVISVKLIIWGGRQWALANLVWHLADEQQKVRAELRAIAKSSLDDWILCVNVHPESDHVTLLTAHNALHQICLSTSVKPHCAIARIASGMRTLLYSGHVVNEDATSFIIASGTVFGEIIVWTCSQRQNADTFSVLTRHIYLGHQGSIFGVHIANPVDVDGVPRRLLASCSDDRTVRIWDISDCNDHAQGDVNVTRPQYETGFGLRASEDTCLTMAWGHQSRIWGVDFIDQRYSTSGPELIMLSRGEDGVCQLWSLPCSTLFSTPDGRSYMVKALSHDHHHTGKNIWSLAHAIIDDRDVVFTGGADGRIIVRTIDRGFHHKAQQSCSTPSSDIKLYTDSRAHIGAESDARQAKPLKHFLLFTTGGILATTERGEILFGEDSCINKWEVIDRPHVKGPATLCDNCAGHLAFFGRADGSIAMYDNNAGVIRDLLTKLPSRASIICVAHSSINEKGGLVYLVVNAFGGGCAKLIKLSLSEAILSEAQYDLDGPSDFVITCAYFNPAVDILLCGSRTGAFLIAENVVNSNTRSSRITCVPRVHGSDTVTSIAAMPHDDNNKMATSHIISTGRDGTYAIHELSTTPSMVLSILHRSTPPFGPTIEGSYIFDAGDRMCVALFGFKSKDFIVWNETQQKSIMSADCGGAHRSWHFAPGVGGQCVGCFAWSQAGRYNAFRQTMAIQDTIENGGHGREIKALAISSHPLEDGSTLIATGAEDTDIRLFKYRKHTGHESALAFFSVLKGHQAGVQDLKFSPCGKYLLSSAGCEELNIWKLEVVPIIGVGSVLVATLPKEAHDSDARIMSVSVGSVNGEGDVLVVGTAYSNGKCKVFHFVTKDAQLSPQHGYDFGAVCLTQVHHLDFKSTLVGATDGFLRVVSSDNGITASKLSNQLHQSSILAMDVRTMPGVGTLVVTGGDDNALGISLLEAKGSLQARRLFMVPHAHAAALTALTIIDSEIRGTEFVGQVVSAGNDQKVILWRMYATLPPVGDSNHAEGGCGSDVLTQLRLVKLYECWTDVADVSGVEAVTQPSQSSDESVRYSGTRVEVLVTGVGMQIVRLEM